MSDLADLAEALTKDLPIAARKVIDTALANGWELNKPGMTVALRLNHPTDELADPVYITWVVSRTAKGAMSFRFDSCGTRGQVPLKPADLLEYLADPTTVYLTDEDIEARDTEMSQRSKPWKENAPVNENLKNQLGGQMIGFEPERQPRKYGGGGPKRKTFAELMEEQKAKARAQQSQAETKNAAPPLRVQIPKV